MKTITRQRLINTLNKISASTDRAIAWHSQVVAAFARHGINAALYQSTGKELPAVEEQRVELEAQLLEIPRNPQDCERILAEWQVGLNRHHRKREKVFAIQAKQKVSDLVGEIAQFGNGQLGCHWVSDELRLIPLDLEILRQEKGAVCGFFLDAVTLANLTLYRDTDTEARWIEIELSEVMAALPFFDWAHTWELRSYTSPSRMRRDGFDNQRGEPKYPDDELRLEYHLYMGVGLETDSPDSYVGFCVSNRVPCR